VFSRPGFALITLPAGAALATIDVAPSIAAPAAPITQYLIMVAPRIG
jgi:hypothetical protein